MSSILQEPSVAGADILSIVEQELQSTPFIDVHTHLFQPSLGELGLWGIDELITYHYLKPNFFGRPASSPPNISPWTNGTRRMQSGEPCLSRMLRCRRQRAE